MGLSSIFDFFNKFIGSRKSALVDQLQDLTARYNDALNAGKDTEAAELKKQLDLLRQKADFTEGDV